MALFSIPLLTAATTTLGSTQQVSDFNSGDATGVVDSVVSLSDAISKNGPVIVICAVFIVLFILVFLLFLKINNDMFRNMINQMNTKNQENADITQKLLNHFLDNEEDEEEEKEDKESKDSKNDSSDKENSTEKKKHTKDLVGLYIDYTTAFKRESNRIIGNLRCNRVAVYVFHNGNQTLYGLPFIKMSCVYEDTMRGSMTLRGRTHVNLPLHLFNDFVQYLYRDGEFSGNITDVEIQDNSIREFLAYSEAKAVFMKAIKKEDGSLAGFTVCEFDKEIDFSDEETYNKIKNEIKDMNTAIRYIVTDEEFSKKYEKMQ